MSADLGLEDILKRDGVLVYKTRGTSMLPMLKQNRDLVTIRPVSGRLKKYDVPLYRRKTGGYLLHRIIAVTDKGYIIRGDNTYTKETDVTDADIVGVLTSFKRKGKDYSVDNRGYRAYVVVWNALYPLRKLRNKIKRTASGRNRKKA